MNDDDNNNVFRFGAVQGGKLNKEVEDQGIPENNYVVIDIDHEEFYSRGFLIFTPHHLAIMHDSGRGAVPALVIPISRVRAAEIVEDEDEEEASN